MPNINKLFNKLASLFHFEISLQDANLYNPLETKRNQIFELRENIQMESNADKDGSDCWHFFACCFHNVSMNQSLLLLFHVFRQCSRGLENYQKILPILYRTDTRNVCVLYVKVEQKVFLMKIDIKSLCPSIDQPQNVAEVFYDSHIIWTETVMCFLLNYLHLFLNFSILQYLFLIKNNSIYFFYLHILLT